MAETGKKVEVRYGAFACTIEGYDNPAEQLEAILSKMQAMIASTPQFSQVASGSEAQDIQDALHPENSDEAPSPGIVIIRDSDDRSSAAKAPPEDDEAIVDAEEVAEPILDTSAEEGEPEVEEVPDSDRSEPTEDFEPFEASMTDAKTGDEHGEPAETSETPAYATAAASLATGAFAAGAATFSMADSDADTPEYADDRSEAEDAEAGWPEEPAEEASASDHWDATPEESGPTDAVSTADDALQDDSAASDADAAVNIFAAAEADTTEPDPSEQDAVQPETADAALPDSTNIFASPDTEPPGDVNIFAAPDAEEALTEDATDAADADATPAEQPEEATAPNIFAEPAAEREVNIFADAETAKEVNIFDSAEPESEPQAAPEPEPERSVASASEAMSWLRENAPAEDPVANIFAAPDAGPETDVPVQDHAAEDAATETEETPFNIFGAPTEDIVAEIEEQTEEVSHSAADVWNAATDALEQATPDTVQDTLDSLGEQVSRFATNTDAGADAEPSSPDTGSAFSIFAAPEEAAKAPPVPVSEPDTDPAQQTNNRFQALLRGNQGGPVMGAPGEPTASDAPPSALSELAPGITSPHDLAQRAGSDSVTDLLAASAAWLTLAEGKARFSRRDVMDVFEKIPGEHSRTLEARIKGYGKLVRSGMLVLVDDGVFAMAQSERQRFQTMLDRG